MAPAHRQGMRQQFVRHGFADRAEVGDGVGDTPVSATRLLSFSLIALAGHSVNC